MREETKGEAADKRLSETPIVGTLFQKKYGGADADTVYAAAKEATQRAASLADIKKSGDAVAAREYLANHRAEIAMAPMARQFETLMGRLRTQETVIRNRKDLNSEEKRARLDQLDKTRQDIAEKFNAAMRKAEAARAS
jgi:Mg-chelatase subunit ChlI